MRLNIEITETDNVNMVRNLAGALTALADTAERNGRNVAPVAEAVAPAPAAEAPATPVSAATVVADISGGKKTRTKKADAPKPEEVAVVATAAKGLQPEAYVPAVLDTIIPIADVRAAIEKYAKKHGVKPTLEKMKTHGGSDAAKIPVENRAAVIADLAL